MSRFLRSIIIASLVSTAAVMPAGTAISFACAMSGKVSSNCCCLPNSDEDCSHITRSCSCCDVAITQSTGASPSAAVPIPVAHSLPVVAVAIAYTVPAARESSRASAIEHSFPTHPPLYILNSAILC